MGNTRPCKTLARAKPVGRVMSWPLIVPLVLQLAVVIIFQVLVGEGGQEGRKYGVCVCV